MAPMRVDLSGCEVLDNHCHGFRLQELLALDPAGWEDRLTMLGMCFVSSGAAIPSSRPRSPRCETRLSLP